jgi:hypothetical protein
VVHVAGLPLRRWLASQSSLLEAVPWGIAPEERKRVARADRTADQLIPASAGRLQALSVLTCNTRISTSDGVEILEA